MTTPRSSLAAMAGAMRDPDPEQGWEATKAALDQGIVLISLETVETLAGWLARERVEMMARQVIGDVEGMRGSKAIERETRFCG